MKKYNYIFLLLIGFILISCKKDVQPDNIGRFMKFYGQGLNDYAYDIQQMSTGEFIIAGFTQNSENVREAYVIKTDQLGNLIWEKTYGDSSSFSEFKKVKIFDDGYVFCGTFKDSSDFINNEVYFVKTDFEGNVTWKYTYGGTEDQEGSDFGVMPNGDFVIAGSSTKQNQKAVGNATGLNQAGTMDCYLLLISSEDFTVKNSLQMGGAQNDRINSITITNSGNFVYCASILNYDINQGDKQLAEDNLSIIRIDADGNKFAQGPQLSYGSLGNDKLVKIIAESNDELIVAGNMFNNEYAIIDRISDRENMSIDNIDKDTYNKINNIEGVENLIINDIKPNGDGGYIITGESKGLALINIDGEGEIVWSRLDSDLSLNNIGKSVISTIEGGFAIIGNTGYGVDGDIMLLKVNNEGNL